MDLLELILEYHKGNERQGPGSEEATLKAYIAKNKHAKENIYDTKY